MFKLGRGHVQAASAVPVMVTNRLPALDRRGLIAVDAITDNDMRLSELEQHLKEWLRRLLLDYVSGINPLAAFSQDAETVGEDSEHVGSFIVVLQAEILVSYVDALKSIDYKGKPIIACVAGKKFALADVVKMEKASIPVFSTPEVVVDALAIMTGTRRE